MTLRTVEELRAFEEVIDRCRDTVWVVSPKGEQYDLKAPMDRCRGLAMMMDKKGAEEPEIYTTCYEDQMVLYDYIFHHAKAA